MHTLPAIFLTSFIIGFSGAAMPGPMLTVTIRESARRGFMAGPLVVLGHGILELAMVTAIFFGLGQVLSQPLFFGVIGVVGGAVLLWMGQGMVRALPGLSLELEAASPKGMHPVLGGVVTSLSNPYFPLWWATAGLALMTRASELGVPGQSVFYVGHILSDLVWYSVVAFVMHHGRRFLTDKRYRYLIGVLAIALIFFGAGFLIDGVVKLTQL